MFFHAFINTQRNKAVVSQMKLEDDSILDFPKAIHEEAVRYFHNLLKEQPNKDHSNLSNLLSEFITEEDNVGQLVDPLKVELKKATRSIPIDGSLGPDGFGFSFFLAC